MKLFCSNSWLSVFNAIMLLAFLAGQIPPCVLAQEDQEQQPLEEGDKVANPIPGANATLSDGPTDAPIEAQTQAPTKSPTNSPTNSPAPTKTPSPTLSPTASQPPTLAPTKSPTWSPTASQPPTFAPSKTFEPTSTGPTWSPTASQPPTYGPTVTPAPTITPQPTYSPTATFRPTWFPTVTFRPTDRVPDLVPPPVSNNDETIELEPVPLPTTPDAIENDANNSISGGRPSPYSRECFFSSWQLGSMGIVTMVFLFGM